MPDPVVPAAATPAPATPGTAAAGARQRQEAATEKAKAAARAIVVPPPAAAAAPPVPAPAPEKKDTPPAPEIKIPEDALKKMTALEADNRRLTAELRATKEKPAIDWSADFKKDPKGTLKRMVADPTQENAILDLLSDLYVNRGDDGKPKNDPAVPAQDPDVVELKRWKAEREAADQKTAADRDAAAQRSVAARILEANKADFPRCYKASNRAEAAELALVAAAEIATHKGYTGDDITDEVAIDLLKEAYGDAEKTFEERAKQYALDNELPPAANPATVPGGQPQKPPTRETAQNQTPRVNPPPVTTAPPKKRLTLEEAKAKALEAGRALITR